MMIRRDRLSREDGLALARRHDGRFPWTYLGVPLETILTEIGLTVDEFEAVCDRFTNKAIFATDRRGDLVKDEYGNLTKINDDNVTGLDEAVDAA